MTETAMDQFRRRLAVYSQIGLPAERRTVTDRRKTHTYLAEDRCCGIADRRKERPYILGVVRRLRQRALPDGNAVDALIVLNAEALFGLIVLQMAMRPKLLYLADTLALL